MILGENFRVAFQALRANLMRSILTTVGIIIGVAAVVAVVSIVQGLQFMITKELQGVGATYVMVMPKREQQGPGVVARQVKLTWDDGQELLRRVPGIKAITPVLVGFGQQVKYRDRQHGTTLIAVNSHWPEINNHTVEQGRFLSGFDLEHRRKVAVIGQKVVEELRLGDPIGKEITVGNLSATVIGVMEERGQALGQDSDDLVFIPFDTGLSIFGAAAGDQVQLRLQAESADVVSQVKDGITRVLRQRHRISEGEPSDFDVLLQDELLDSISSVLGMVTTVVGAVVGVALLVGGIGKDRKSVV